MELSCSVKNYTEVSLLWHKDGSDVAVGDPTFTYSELVLTSTLTIDSVQNEDLGEYRCGIGTSRSRESSSVSSVSVKAVGDTVLRGSGSATLRCDLTGSSSQPSSVIWTGKNSSIIKATIFPTGFISKPCSTVKHINFFNIVICFKFPVR